MVLLVQRYRLNSKTRMIVSQLLPRVIGCAKGKGGFSMKLNKLLEVLGNDIIVSGDTDIDISALGI